jgi:hypothetical protein
LIFIHKILDAQVKHFILDGCFVSETSEIESIFSFQLFPWRLPKAK